MFFPDMLLAMTEMMRVLKPGGRIATTVWNVPEKNFWATAILNIVSPELYWNFMTEVAAPVVAALINADDSLKRKIWAEVFESINHKYPKGKLAIDSSALLIYGEK